MPYVVLGQFYDFFLIRVRALMPLAFLFKGNHADHSS